MSRWQQLIFLIVLTVKEMSYSWSVMPSSMSFPFDSKNVVLVTWNNWTLILKKSTFNRNRIDKHQLYENVNESVNNERLINKTPQNSCSTTPKIFSINQKQLEKVHYLWHTKTFMCFIRNYVECIHKKGCNRRICHAFFNVFVFFSFVFFYKKNVNLVT